MPSIGVMAYRISYLDTLRLPRLLAVADTTDNAHAVGDQVTAALPESAGRLVITEDPLLGLASQVVQPPQSMDATAGLSVLYLGGTITPASNWQAVAIAGLRAELVVIANPRRERPPTSGDEVLVQIAWQRRHLWRADIALFWFEETDTGQMSLFEFATQLGDPLPMAVGAAPGFTHRTEVCAYTGHLLPDLTVHDTLAETVNAAVELVREQARPPAPPRSGPGRQRAERATRDRGGQARSWPHHAAQ
jgi:Nucleoside 2-deoxyribosyltransferase like